MEIISSQFNLIIITVMTDMNSFVWASLIAQLVKNLPAVQRPQVSS